MPRPGFSLATSSLNAADSKMLAKPSWASRYSTTIRRLRRVLCKKPPSHISVPAKPKRPTAPRVSSAKNIQTTPAAETQCDEREVTSDQLIAVLVPALVTYYSSLVTDHCF